MAGTVNVVLQASVTVFGIEANVDLSLIGAPFSIRLAVGETVDLMSLWGKLSGAIEDIAGFGLPDLGAWSKLVSSSFEVQPSLYIGPSGADPKRTSVYLTLDLVEPIRIGGSIDLGGGVTVSITPDFSVWALYIGYDAAAGGLDLRAKVTTPTTTASGAAGEPKSQIVSYPFPVPAQDNSGAFQVHYIGLGQRVGPTVSVSANDPMTAIFDQLESELKGDDPRSVLTTLAETFYQPDRDWFIAADLEMKGFRIRVLFNDPTMYGLEITVAANSPTPFAGLLFEILYQKLSPNLGLYYGALTLPTLMRRIPMEGFILILPGFAIWVYTNGDFRVNVGWPLGDNSIGISFDILIGRAGFYFAKLRSSDNPGAQANADYNPILAFGMAVSLSAGYAFNASVFSASIALSLQATFQGLLAWRAGNQVYAPPDHYWFAATASLSVLIQGSVDFSIIRASVTISFTANVGIAFETGYATYIEVAAEVEVEVSVKVVFFTIHLSFHTSVSSQFTIGSGDPASIDGPRAAGLAIVGGQGALSPVQLRALDLAEQMIARRPAARLRTLAPTVRVHGRADLPRPGEPLRGERAGGAGIHLAPTAEPPARIALSFVLQPTATYAPDGAFAVVASLLTDCPGPPGSPGPASPGDTSFERLVRAMVGWLLELAPAGRLSHQFAALSAALGHGAEPPLGDWTTFEAGLRGFLQTRCAFTLTGVDASDQQPDQAAAVLPLFDVLRLVRPDGTVVDVDSYGPAPANYPLALEYYFQDLAGTANPAPASRRAHATAPTGSPSERGIGSFLFLDYFLMQARNAVNTLWPAAVAYEKTHKYSLLAEIAIADAGDHLEVAGLVTDFVDRVTGDAELTDLLAAFDYASAAGIGSRFLLGGLQLPDPAQVPVDPTPANMAEVPTAPLFVLTGQQCAVAAGAAATATLSLNPSTTLPPVPIVFEGSPGLDSTAQFNLPPSVPGSPSPAWQGVASPTTGGDGSLDVTWLPPVTPQPMYLALKNQIGWERAEGTAVLLPLPEPLQGLAVARQGIGLAVTADAPARGNGSLAAASAPPVLRPATAALQIRLSLSQVPSSQAGSVAATGSPVAGSPSANATARQYLPHLYQLGGTDQATRDLIQAALQGDLRGARISLLYPATEAGSSPGRSGSPSSATTVMRSDPLGPEVLLAKTNLSTLNQVPETGRMFLLQAQATVATATDLAPVTDVPGFLRLVWELSVVNAPGYFLFYQTQDGADLPASMFASAGVSGGQTAELDILVEWGDSAAPTAVPAYANAVVVDGPGGAETLYAGVLESVAGPAIQSFSPSYPAGSVAFSVAWERPQDSRQVPVDELYHLLQYAILAGGAYEGSVWSLPIGPANNALPAAFTSGASPSASQYVQSVPAAGFLRQASGAANRYGIIDLPVTAQLRIVDIYGNALPDVHATTVIPLYQDPLISLGEWPGLFSSYRVTAAPANTAQLAITLHFDPDAIVPPNGSPTSGIAPDRARDAWTSTLARYQLIVDQLTDPNVRLEILTSLLGGPAAAPRETAKLVALARTIAAEIETALATTVSPNEPVVPPQLATLSIPVPFSAIVGLTDTITPLQVSVAVSRPPALVDPQAAATIPATVQVAYEVHPDVTTPDASPGAIGNIMAFAEPFESAFQDFDGQGGCLKLAQRAGVSIGVDARAVPALWFMRWSATSGVTVTLHDDLVFFALAPLSTTPMTRDADGQTWSGVDLDAWARDFLAAFDAFLAPQYAAAIGVLDLREGTSLFDHLARTKERLAAAIKLGLAPLFDEQQGLGDLGGARDRYEQAMLTALASAFTVTTVIQVPATVTTKGSSAPNSPGVAPRLFGNIGSPDASPGATRSSPYSLSGGNLDLSPGEGWMTTLLTVAQVSQQAELTLPLEYQVSYLQHDFEPEDGYLGYIPSSWLKFAIPAAQPLEMTIAAEASLPVPLIFQPTAPILSTQSVTAAPMASPFSPQTAQEEIAAAMRWIYSAKLTLSLAAQDALYFDATYNRTDPGGLRAFRDSVDPRLALFDALAAFRGWYAAAAPQFGAIVEAAFPARPGAPAAASPAVATALIEGFQNHAFDVARAWERFHEPPTMSLAAALEETTDHFYLTTEGLSGGSPALQVTLYGKSDAGGPPAVWPTLVTADGQVWTPDGSPSAAGSPDGWFEASHLFERAPNLDTLTLEFGPLDIMARQSATLAARIVRNAGLVNGLHTAEPFIYRTQEASFSSSIIPLIHRPTLPLVTPGPSLVETLTEILTPLEQVGVGLAPNLRLSAVYGFAVAPRASLMTQTAMTLVRGAALGSPGALAESAAQALAEWFADVGPSTLNATLTLTLTVFGTRRGASLPLVQFDQIVIPTAGLGPAWWSASP